MLAFGPRSGFACCCLLDKGAVLSRNLINPENDPPAQRLPRGPGGELSGHAELARKGRWISGFSRKVGFPQGNRTEACRLKAELTTLAPQQRPWRTSIDPSVRQLGPICCGPEVTRSLVTIAPEGRRLCQARSQCFLHCNVERADNWGIDPRLLPASTDKPSTRPQTGRVLYASRLFA